MAANEDDRLYDLPQYCNFTVLDDGISTGFTTLRAQVVGHPGKRVIIKTVSQFTEDKNALLEHESLILTKLNNYREYYHHDRQKQHTRRRGSFVLPPVPSMNLSLTPSNSSELQKLPVKAAIGDFIPHFLQLEKTIEYETNALVLEDFDGIPLTNYFPEIYQQTHHGSPKRSLTFQDKLSIFIQVAEALNFIHRAEIAHLQICPSNILVKQTEDGGFSIQLVNFENSTSFDQIHLASIKESADLSYISPELTGRTDRIIDYRSDMYSLGITMWEIFAETQVFKDMTDFDIVYAHLAKNLPSLHERNHQVPEIISQIVSKLTAKNPSDRYQLIGAAAYDLNECQRKIQEIEVNHGIGKAISTKDILQVLNSWNFHLGSKDYCPVLVITDSAFGRTQTRNQVIESFESWLNASETKRQGTVLLLSGEEGCGEGSFWNQLSHYALVKGFHTVSAIYSHADVCVPLGTFVSLLNQLVNLILTESNENLLSWENLMLDNIGLEVLQLLASLVPTLNYAIPQLKSLESVKHGSSRESKLFAGIQKFIELFACFSRPLVIYLAHLQCDPGSIKLLNYLIDSPLGKTCYFVAYVETKESSDSSSIRPERFHGLVHVPIPKLDTDDIKSMLMETVRPCHDDYSPLASALWQRSGGNYSLVKEIMKYCEKSGIIFFDKTLLVWRWELDRMETELKISQDTVGFMVQHLQSLDPKTKQLLKIAGKFIIDLAIIGYSFDVRLLCLVSSESTSQIHTILSPLVADGYVAPFTPLITIKPNNAEVHLSKQKLASTLSIISNTGPGQESRGYKFTQKELYEYLLNSNSSEEFQAISLSIARNLRTHLDEKSDENEIEIIRHYRNSLKLLEDTAEIAYVAELHYNAAEKVSSGLPLTALEYLEISSKLLEPIENHSAELFNFHFTVKVKLCQVLVLNQRFDEADKSIKEAKRFVTNPTNESKWLCLCFLFKVAERKMTEAFEIGKDSDSPFAKLLQIHHYSAENSFNSIRSLETQFANHTKSSLLKNITQLPEVALNIATTLRTAMELCELNGEYGFMGYFNILGCSLALQNGVTDETIFYFSSIQPFLLGKSFGYWNFPIAKFVGDLVLQAIPNRSFENRILAFIDLLEGNSYFWTFSEAYDRCLQMVKMASDRKRTKLVSRMVSVFKHKFFLSFGKSLVTLHEFCKRVDMITSRITDPDFSLSRNAKSIIESLSTEFTDEDLSAEDPSLQPLFAYANLLKAFIYDFPQKQDLYDALKGHSNTFYGSWLHVDFLLFGMFVENDRINPDSNFVSTNYHQIEEIFKSCEHLEQKSKHNLALAEWHRSNGKMQEAICAYEKAIDSIQSSGNHIFAGLANERYGRFWLGVSSRKIGKVFLLNASIQWEQWGCDIKIEGGDKYTIDGKPRADSSTNSRRASIRRSKWNTGNHKEGETSSPTEVPKPTFAPRAVTDIDINTVLKVTNSITSETNFEILIDTILGQLMSNTGATKAVFFINEESRLKIQRALNSEGSVDLNGIKPELVAPLSLSNYVFRTEETKVYSEVPTESFLVNDVYIEKVKPCSILCCPIKHQNIVTGAVYLENKFQNFAFNNARVNLVKSLMASASISIANAQLLKVNKQLSLALQNSTREMSSGFTVETPIQRVFDAIKQLKQRFDVNDPIIKTLDVVLSTLTSDGLFSANLGEVNDKDGKGIDLDTKDWIENSLLMTGHTADKEETVTVLKPTFAAATIDQYEELLMKYLSPDRKEEIKEQLSLSGVVEFNCFKLAEATEGRPLYFLTTHILKKYRLNEAFNLDSTNTHNFIQKIESSYNKLPFHNSVHATDVLQGAELLLFNTDIMSHFSCLEVFSLCIASAVHDLDHPGINNNFLVQIQHPLAVMYNDAAVLESHHVARAFEISNMAGCQIFSSMTPEQYRQCRKMIISVVLATDLAQHFQFISKFKGKTSSNSLKLEDDTDRHLVMEMVVKCGDLGNPVKDFETARTWTNLVMEEFFRQGDKEKKLGLPISKFMDRNDTNVSKCQVGFIDFLVTPLYDAWYSFSKTPYTNLCMANLANNRKQWLARADDANVLPGVKGNDYENLNDFLDVNVPSFSFGAWKARKKTIAKKYIPEKGDQQVKSKFESEISANEHELQAIRESTSVVPART